MKLNKTLLLYIVIIIEGYVVLSSEMLAIRQTIPFVGSGTDTVSIIIAAVLMPLAFGYHSGGRFRAGLKNGKSQSVRKKLVFSIIVAQAIFMIGLSYYTLTFFFFGLIDAGVKNRIILTTLYSMIFLVTPVFLLGQTIPLVSNFFSKQRLSQITGRMLFFSTMGSFLGAVFSTLILMAFIGVHYTVVVVSALLTLLVMMMSRDLRGQAVIISVALCGMTYVANSDQLMRELHIVEDNKYNTIMVFEDPKDKSRHMIVNLTASSKYSDNGDVHEYLQFIEGAVLDPIRDGETPKDILVIGAGAFTFGVDDHFNNYDFVDLDGSLKHLSEDYILRQKLTENKHFHPVEARAFLMDTDKKYDLVLLDAYNGDLTLPEHLVTQEFYKQVKDHLKPRGIVTANFITSPGFDSKFSRHLDNTFRSVFPYVSRQIILDHGSFWTANPNETRNVIYTYRQNDEENTDEIYTDNINRIFYDKPHSR